ncbi:MAG: glycosyltransferase family 2 protein [Candidatus Falkowbacteria bacterium]
MNYLKISKASELSGKDKKLYRALEILPGFLSWATLLVLLIFSYFKPIWIAYFIIGFDVYWLLRVLYLAIHLIVAYKELKKNIKTNWKEKCENIEKWQDITHLIILPTYNESLEVIRPSFQAIVNDGYPTYKMIVVLAVEQRAGDEALKRAEQIKQEFGHKFRNFLITIHPDNIEGEIKGKGANQTWATREVKRKIIDPENLDYNKIITSVFDIDTCVNHGYFHCLTYKFLTVKNPHRASYQPIPVYHNNLWQAPFFARTTAISNTFWQMMQQLRKERLATYSSHSMSFKALIDIDFWSTNMVSEDSRIFWHCLAFYHGDYRVEPLHFPVSMDVCMDKNKWQTLKNLYKQQRRWGWGVENIPYIIFNFIKDKSGKMKWRKKLFYIFIQIEGFHSWATNALIIGVIGWMPLLIGGDQFNATVLSSNLPQVTRALMTLAMIGMVLSAIISTLLLPKRPEQYGFIKSVKMVVQWIFLPITIIFFGAIPGLEAQTRLMLGKHMDFWVTPKKR